jgi:hypothetical protein
MPLKNSLKCHVKVVDEIAGTKMTRAMRIIKDIKALARTTFQKTDNLSNIILPPIGTLIFMRK